MCFRFDLIRLRAVLLITMAVLAGCAKDSGTEPENLPPATVLPPLASTTPVEDFSLPAQGYDDRSFYGSVPGYSDEEIGQIASMPMAMFQLRWLLSEEGASVVARLRQRHPDIVVLGVLQNLSVPEDWGTPAAADRFPLSYELYDLLVDRTFETTDGEPVYMWSDARMFNPMRGASLDTSLQSRMVDLICAYANRHPGVIDGIAHDYMSPRPWAYPDGDLTHTGSIDLDHDGVAFDDDPNERDAWVAWQRELARTLQERFGPGFIQVANGRLPLDDPTVAQQLAGVILQKFPTLVWNKSALEGLEFALKMRQPDWLVPRRGQYWNFYWADTVTFDGNVAFRRLASMLTGDLYETNTTRDGVFEGIDPLRVELGVPLDEAQRIELVDGVAYRRDFTGGSVRIEFDAAGRVSSTGIQPTGSSVWFPLR